MIGTVSPVPDLFLVFPCCSLTRRWGWRCWRGWWRWSFGGIRLFKPVRIFLICHIICSASAALAAGRLSVAAVSAAPNPAPMYPGAAHFDLSFAGPRGWRWRRGRWRCRRSLRLRRCARIWRPDVVHTSILCPILRSELGHALKAIVIATTPKNVKRTWN